MQFSRRNQLKLISGLPLMSFFGGCASTKTPISPSFTWTQPQLKVGERWSYNLIDGFNREVIAKPNYRVKSIESTVEIEVSQLEQGRNGIERYQANGFVLEEPTFDSPITYEAAQPLISPTASQSITRFKVPGDDRLLTWQQSVAVTDFLSVTTPAGTFEVALIERRINFRHPDLFRGGSNRVDNLWYAPKVKRWVKREWRGSYIDPSDVEPGRMITSTQREIWRRWELTSFDSSPIAR